MKLVRIGERVFNMENVTTITFTNEGMSALSFASDPFDRAALLNEQETEMLKRWLDQTDYYEAF